MGNQETVATVADDILQSIVNDINENYDLNALRFVWSQLSDEEREKIQSVWKKTIINQLMLDHETPTKKTKKICGGRADCRARGCANECQYSASGSDTE